MKPQITIFYGLSRDNVEKTHLVIFGNAVFEMVEKFGQKFQKNTDGHYLTLNSI
jgi:hypothetical protein